MNPIFSSLPREATLQVRLTVENYGYASLPEGVPVLEQPTVPDFVSKLEGTAEEFEAGHPGHEGTLSQNMARYTIGRFEGWMIDPLYTAQCNGLRFDMNSEPNPIPSFCGNAVSYIVRLKLTEEFLNAHFGEDTWGMAYYQPWYRDWSTQVREKARTALKDPARLRRLYETNRETLVVIASASPIRDSLKQYILNMAVPAFTVTIDSEFEDALREDAQLYESLIACVDGETCSDEQFVQRYENYIISSDSLLRIAEQRGVMDVKLLQFRQRRYIEGGDVLVAEWVSILQDFASRL